jgi:hypothetical protein
MKSEGLKCCRFTFLLFFFVTCTLCPLTAQENFSWWNELHNWDGLSPWEGYLIVSPDFFGPNALPVPKLQNGRIIQSARATLGAA